MVVGPWRPPSAGLYVGVWAEGGMSVQGFCCQPTRLRGGVTCLSGMGLVSPTLVKSGVPGPPAACMWVGGWVAWRKLRIDTSGM